MHYVNEFTYPLRIWDAYALGGVLGCGPDTALGLLLPAPEGPREAVDQARWRLRCRALLNTPWPGALLERFFQEGDREAFLLTAILCLGCIPEGWGSRKAKGSAPGGCGAEKASFSVL